MNNNMNHEKKLIEFFGYHLIGPNNSNRWKILNDKNNEIGFIQYKKLYCGNKKKGYPKTYGYEMQVHNDIMNYNNQRKLTEKEDYFYIFDLYGNKKIELDLNTLPSLYITKNNSSFIRFSINNYGLYINLLTESDNYKVDQALKYENVNDNNNHKQYSYIIRYCDKDHDLFDSRDGVSSNQIFIMKDNNEDQLRVSKKEYRDRRLESTSAKMVDGDFEEAILNHELGIGCFNEVRALINELLPMNSDVISKLLNEDIINNYNLSIFTDNKKIDNNFERVLK